MTIKMVEQFREYISQHGLVVPGEKILVGVSGGIDSMVMLDLFLKADFSVGIAHCNFQLRGEESDKDEALVAETAAKYGIPFHNIRFETEKEAVGRGESIQMAARRLRYDYFELLCANHGYSKIAVAHHRDDSAETFFINLIRGTGLRGLCSIPRQNGRIIRPLLFVGREEIAAYAAECRIPYREDASNVSLKYLRNRLRHELLPLLRNISDHFPDTMAANIERFGQAQAFVDSQIGLIKREVMEENAIDAGKLLHYSQPEFILFELIHPYEFSPEQISDLFLAAEHSHTGKYFYSPSHAALLDRGKIIIAPHAPDKFEEELIEKDDPRLEWLDANEIADLHTSPDVALLAADDLRFPLLLRLWHEGDRFVPLGMSGHKKVSDFLIDEKVPLNEKSRQTVLMSGRDIVWLKGRRIDDRYKITPQTKRAVLIKPDL